MFKKSHAGVSAKERKVRQELEQMVTEKLPMGVGALSWITLPLEIRGWERFHNRELSQCARRKSEKEPRFCIIEVGTTFWHNLTH